MQYDYSIAYCHKSQLKNYFKSSFIDEMEKSPTWGGDRTTSCITAHFLPNAVHFHVNLGDSNHDFKAEDVFHDHLTQSAAHHAKVETKKVMQLTIHAPPETGEKMVNDICFKNQI